MRNIGTLCFLQVMSMTIAAENFKLKGRFSKIAVRKKVFDYLKEAADVISVRAEDQTAILTKQYEKIDFFEQRVSSCGIFGPVRV